MKKIPKLAMIVIVVCSLLILDFVLPCDKICECEKRNNCEFIDADIAVSGFLYISDDTIYWGNDTVIK